MNPTNAPITPAYEMHLLVERKAIPIYIFNTFATVRIVVEVRILLSATDTCLDDITESEKFDHLSEGFSSRSSSKR